MNSSKPQTHTWAAAALHQHPHCLAWQQTSQETKTLLSTILPTEDNVLDSDMSQRLECVRYCFKISTIEEDWITKMRLGRDEWSGLWLDESWSPLQIALIIGECITLHSSGLFPLYMSYFNLTHKGPALTRSEKSSSICTKVGTNLCHIKQSKSKVLSPASTSGTVHLLV